MQIGHVKTNSNKVNNGMGTPPTERKKRRKKIFFVTEQTFFCVYFFLILVFAYFLEFIQFLSCVLSGYYCSRCKGTAHKMMNKTLHRALFLRLLGTTHKRTNFLMRMLHRLLHAYISRSYEQFLINAKPKHSILSNHIHWQIDIQSTWIGLQRKKSKSIHVFRRAHCIFKWLTYIFIWAWDRASISPLHGSVSHFSVSNVWLSIPQGTFYQNISQLTATESELVLLLHFFLLASSFELMFSVNLSISKRVGIVLSWLAV